MEVPGGGGGGCKLFVLTTAPPPPPLTLPDALLHCVGTKGADRQTALSLSRPPSSLHHDVTPLVCLSVKALTRTGVWGISIQDWKGGGGEEGCY